MVSAEQNYRGVFDNRIGFGTKPALLVIDFILAYTTPGAPFYGEGVVRAVAETVPVLEAARAASLPVIHTRVLFHPSGVDGGLFVRKVKALRMLVDGETLAEIDPQVAPRPDELVIVKNYSSCFFGTSLASTLAALHVDTLVLTGCSTSGCVRAAAVDGIQHGYHVIVPRECVGDRHDAPHQAALFDINAKYGDVVSKAELTTYFSSLARPDADRRN
jgi:maleamate amidohydrolase